MFKFVVQNTGVSQELEQSVFPIGTEFVGFIPVVHMLMSASPLPGVDYIPYGSNELVKVAAERGWRGCFFSENNFKYSTALEHRHDMLNSGVMTVKDALRWLEYDDPDDKHFVRPDNDLKSFAGAVVSASYTLHMLRTALAGASTLCSQLALDDRIVISDATTILQEYRWFIVDRQVISGALYRRDGKLVSEPVLDAYSLYQAQKLADVWLPHDCCVMDTAITDHGTRVVEFNCINCSGLYGHSPKPIFNAMLAYAEKQNVKA